MPTLTCAAKVARNVSLLVYCDRLNRTSISLLPHSATKRGDKKIYPDLFSHRSTVCSLLIGKEKKLPG